MISKLSYLHTLEEELYEKIMDNIPFREEIMHNFINYDEKIRKPDLLGKTVQITEKQFKNIFDIVNKLSFKSNITPPKCFVYEDFYYGMESKGIGEPWIEISAKTLQDFTESELCFLLGKELCNIKLNHTQTYTMINEFLSAAASSNVLGSDTVAKSYKVMLYKWCRVSNYSSDCYGYLMSRSLPQSISAILKLVLNNSYLAKNIDLKEYIKQAEKINELDDNIYNFTKLDEQVPYAPYRIKNLLSYASSERGIAALKDVWREE